MSGSGFLNDELAVCCSAYAWTLQAGRVFLNDEMDDEVTKRMTGKSRSVVVEYRAMPNSP